MERNLRGDPAVSLLQRIARAVEVRTVGAIDDPPGSRTVFANVVRAPGDCLWYLWDYQQKEPIPFEKRNVRGRLVNVLCYEKQASRGTTTKVRVELDCGLTGYQIETSLYNHSHDALVTSGKMLVASLTGQDPADTPVPEAIERGEMITVGVRPAEQKNKRDEVLFMHVHTDRGRSYHGGTPESLEQALGMVRETRGALNLTHDPFDNRISNRSEPHEAGNGDGQGGGSGSASSKPNGPTRPDEELYRGQQPPQTSGGGVQGGPPPRGHAPDKGSAANPSGMKQASGTQAQFAPKPLLEEPDPLAVRCPSCGAVQGEPCRSDEGGELDERHKSRHTMAEGLAGDAEQFLKILTRYLDHAHEQGNKSKVVHMIHDIGGATGRFPEEEWAKIVSTIGPYHEDATDILDQYREPQN